MCGGVRCGAGKEVIDYLRRQSMMSETSEVERSRAEKAELQLRKAKVQLEEVRRQLEVEKDCQGENRVKTTQEVREGLG